MGVAGFAVFCILCETKTTFMKKLFAMAALVAGFSVSSYAQNVIHWSNPSDCDVAIQTNAGNVTATGDADGDDDCGTATITTMSFYFTGLATPLTFNVGGFPYHDEQSTAPLGANGCTTTPVSVVVVDCTDGVNFTVLISD